MKIKGVDEIISIVLNDKYPYTMSTIHKKNGDKVYGYIDSFESEADDPDGYGSIDILLEPRGGTWVNFPDIDYIEYDDKELEYVSSLNKQQAKKYLHDKLVELSNKK